MEANILPEHVGQQRHAGFLRRGLCSSTKELYLNSNGIPTKSKTRTLAKLWALVSVAGSLQLLMLIVDLDVHNRCWHAAVIPMAASTW